jgi:translation initiation factor 2 subunit 2
VQEEKVVAEAPAATIAAADEVLNSAGVEVDPPPYSYVDLLERAVGLLHQHNPEYSEKRRHTMKPPQLVRRE